MKYYSKPFLPLLCITLLFSMTACGRKKEDDTETATTKQAATYQIGICQLHSDRFSNQLIQGFQDAINRKLTSDNISFSLKEANGDTAAMTAACTELDSNGLNLIFYENQGIAADIDASAYKTKIFATPELPVIAEAEDTLLQLLPDISYLGILYDSTDPSSLLRNEELKQNLDADGIHYREYASTDSASLAENALHISDQCDSLYIITSDLITENTDKLSDTFLPAGIPAVADSMELGRISIASVAVAAGDYGTQLGNIAAEYLLNNTEPDTVQLDTSELIQKYYNPVLCEDFEIEVPDGMTAMPAEQADFPIQ